MPVLLYSRLSPYAAKARIAAAHVGYPARSELTDTWQPPPEFLDANPLGKVPVLLFDDGSALHDSRVILRFLDEWSGGRLYPADREKRLAVEQLEALCDGICDCMQAIMSEKRFRPEDKIHPPWIEWQWSKVRRALERLEADIPEPAGEVNAAHAALRGMLGYLSIRFEGQWEQDRPRLVDWVKRFDTAFPHLAACAPALSQAPAS